MRSLRRNAEPTPRDLYRVAVDAVKEANMVRGDPARRKALLEQARELYNEGQALDLKAKTNTPVPDELSRWSGLPRQGEVTIDKLAELVGAAYTEIRERSDDFIWETARARFDMDEDDEAYDEALMDAQSDVESEYVFKPWYDGVLAAATRMFGDHGLVLTPVRVPRGAPKDARPYMYKVSPASTWRHAADSIIDTINGVGQFYFSGIKDFAETADGSVKNAVLDHLKWMWHRPDVYGERSYVYTFERHWR